MSTLNCVINNDFHNISVGFCLNFLFSFCCKPFSFITSDYRYCCNLGLELYRVSAKNDCYLLYTRFFSIYFYRNIKKLRENEKWYLVHFLFSCQAILQMDSCRYFGLICNNKWLSNHNTYLDSQCRFGVFRFAIRQLASPSCQSSVIWFRIHVLLFHVTEICDAVLVALLLKLLK